MSIGRQGWCVWHRWTAHKKQGAETINVMVTETKSESEFLALACQRNATAGKQLSQRDKRRMGILLFNCGEGYDKKEIKDILSVEVETVHRWLKDVEKQLEEERDETVHSMWLACHTHKQIADAVGLSQREIDTRVEELQKMPESDKCQKMAKSAISHESDFDHKIYDVWNFPKATNEVQHPGNVPPEIVDNLLFYYTKPFDVVFDPFAKTADKLAADYGVSAPTIKRDGKFAAAVDSHQAGGQGATVVRLRDVTAQPRS